MAAEDSWDWPPSMDAVVAAPESHRVLLENEDVRVLEVTIPAGHREPEHTHRAHSVMIVDGPAQIRPGCARRHWRIVRASCRDAAGSGG